MHGRGGEERKRGRHMLTVPTRVSVADGSSSSSSSSPNSFFKDGRKISVGDCALFKPPQDSPPFIGIIRWLTISRENKLKLGVNWLYRPSEIKLGKGVLLDAALNEIFYSFHKDEIPAASLLHPCKVAFLAKGVELPSGISSFVCRRVYDITNKCLWWLTDQDYMNERQEEVDQLLYKTRVEMHATVQSGGRSPKPMNGPTSASQLKVGSDGVQNSASSFSSQVKGKKRERGDQGSEPVKRERTTKMEDGDSVHSRQESILKSEIAKITDKGGLVDSEGVEKLLQLMLPDRNEKKIDLAGRSMLASVVAATDKFDCLSQFVQLKGVPVYDEWLQDVHKGKIGDGSGAKDSDKSVEEFLLVLLRALDKLPVNLNALQMCNLGKSVNHLRTHKNLEIQKKARSLVDTWKKRVQAEMDANSNVNPAVSWSARPRLSEASNGGNRHSGGSTDVAVKSSVTQLSVSKSASVKLVQGDSVTKSASASPGSKSVPSPVSASSNLKDGQSRIVAVGVTVDLPLTTPRDEKSSSSSQSHNNSQSCSNDHARTGGVSGKEDARSSTAGSMNVNKISGGSSRPRKSINGFPGSALSGVQRETVSSRSSSLHKSPPPEKSSQPGLASEKVLDGSAAEGNSHKLIVKIPNRGRSPAQSGSGGSFEDPSNMNSRASSPMQLEKHDQLDRSVKEKADVYRATVTSDVNNESWQSNDFKDVLTGSDEGDGSPAAVTAEEDCRAGDNSKKIAEVPKAASSSSGNEKSDNLQEASFSSMHALIESCVKYSEGNASVGDDLGMNLLASVAAGEMSKSESPTDSPQRSTPVSEHLCEGNDSRVKSPPVDELARDESQSNDGADDEYQKHGFESTTSGAKNGVVKSSSVCEQNSVAEDPRNLYYSSVSIQRSAGLSPENKEKSSEVSLAPSGTASPPSTVEKIMEGDGKPLQDKKIIGGVSADGIPDIKHGFSGLLSNGNKVSDVSSRVAVGKEAIEESSLHAELDVDGKIKNLRYEGMDSSVPAEEKPSTLKRHSELVKGTCEDVLLSSGFRKDLISGKASELKAEKADETDDTGHHNQAENQRTDPESNDPSPSKKESNDLSIPENRAVGGSSSAVTDHDDEHVEENLESKEANDQLGEPVLSKVSSDLPMQEVEEHLRSRRSKLTCMEAEEADECTSTTADASSVSAAGVAEADAKVEFDLNEGFNADDGKYGEPSNLIAPGCSTALQLISPLPFAVSSMSSGLPASVTVPAAAKGPCIPPEDLLKSKGEVGWKGSAATSAFRPAEPRKALEMLLGTSISVLEPTAGKQGRPALDIDLNVPDERILEDMAPQGPAQEICSRSDPTNNNDLAHDQSMSIAPVRCSGGLDLDLNQIDEASEMGNYSLSNSCRMDNPLLSVKSTGPLNGEVSLRRDFDLNDGPVVEELSAEPAVFSQHTRSSVPSQPPLSGLRMNNTEVGNFSWFPPANTYSAVAIPSIMSDRGDQPFPIVATGGPQRMLGPTSGSNPFNSDLYRGSVLSSSPAVPYPSTSFPYPVFPFGSSFPLPSAAFAGGSAPYLDSSSAGRFGYSAVRSQLLGPGAMISSHYPRPYVVNLPDGSNNSSGESTRKWGRQGLDLNAGPGGPDLEGRDVTSPLAPRQLSVAGSQALAEEHVRMFQMQGGPFKRKEPEGGWDGYKQSSWK
ncbi:hypothetical protein PRUPE_5G177500 [Prunus persica]|uniref:BAH domain-containing protein n=1 Tax=Prunus persica TaxID=3760 RepID=A0A251PA22_PRUPE|nr:uncharacterized protein LOC18778016 [Prunus persica]ONI08422.1 hypothetical protein PRUPE_5G177500 [Prunus persica]ONI08423.1 hypothetical protein PRUPE_5G177500 [Prunus persica]